MTMVEPEPRTKLAAPSPGEVLVEARGVGKRYCRDFRRSLRYGLADIAREFLGHPLPPQLRADEFHALRDVSFTVRRGECLGLIGRNGAGKSTLLKILSGLVKPDAGEVIVRGRLGALIELGAGMHPLLTGRENIRVSAAILGLTRREIEERMEAIIAFADLGEFLDAPVQSYSSGMRVRLGFAVAAHLEPDVLLVDEVLAVGDAGFRSRCYGKLEELRRHCAIVFVSHHAPHLARVCGEGMVLASGRVLALRPIEEALSVYEKSWSEVQRAPASSHGTGRVRMTELHWKSGHAGGRPCWGEPCCFALTLECREATPVVVSLVFRTTDGQPVAECTNFRRDDPLLLPLGRCTVLVDLSRLQLNAGTYTMAAFVTCPDMLTHYEWIENAATIEVCGRRATAAVQFCAAWEVVP